MFEKVLQPGNLSAAWKQVQANKGAAGIDGMSVEDFPTFIREHGETIGQKLEEGSYDPAAFLGFQILRGRVRWSRKSKKRFIATVTRITGRTRGVSPRQVIEELNRYTRGALNYYMIGVRFAEVRNLDQWIRRRSGPGCRRGNGMETVPSCSAEGHFDQSGRISVSLRPS